MANTEFGKDKIKRVICLVLIFGGFAILHNFVPEGLDQAGWDGFLVLFVTVLLWLTEAVPMAVTSIFALFFGAWVGFETEATILSGFAGTGVFFLLGTMIIGQIFSKVGPWQAPFSIRSADVRQQSKVGPAECDAGAPAWFPCSWRISPLR